MDANPPLHLLAAFQRRYATLSPRWIVQAPGRETWVAAAANDADVYALYAADLESYTRFNWRSAKHKETLMRRPIPHWARYASGVIVELGAQGLDVSGIRAVIIGEDTAGPRYNHAVGMVFAALWHEIHGKPYSPEKLQEIVDRVHRTYIDE